MTIKERIQLMVFALVIGLVGVFLILVSWHGTFSAGPQAAGVIMFMGAIFVFGALYGLRISLTPVRWWPKDWKSIIEQMK